MTVNKTAGYRVLLPLLLGLFTPASYSQPLLTGIIQDAGAQTIEMPRLAGAWQVQIAWMAPEGESVSAGEPVVKVDPGTLIADEEQARTDLEKKKLESARRLDELALEILDAEQALAEAESAVRLAKIDARIPEGTIPKLDFDRYQLALTVALQAEQRAEAELAAKRLEREGAERETALEIAKAETQWQRLKTSLEQTEIVAEKAGFLIYGENPFSGKKIFPGETLFAGFEIASVASREGLQFRFWVHEADIHKIPVGTSLTISADAVDGIRIPAEVTWTSNQASSREDWSAGGYFELLAEPLEVLPEALMPGMAIMGRPNT